MGRFRNIRADSGVSGIGSIAGFVSELELVIVGDGPYRSKVEAYAAASGVAGTTLRDLFRSGKKIAWFQRAAVHIQTSLKEGWGLSM